jgi:2-oxoglutarate dehydrogenase E1 component
VRISGQDVRRGTFSHRHIGLADSGTGEYHFPIEKFKSKGAELEVWNSALSELAVLGFEYGYSLAAPKTLTVWEAQFGDFSNGAQIVIDQFISSAEYKWDRMSGVMMSLPHGYEGQGPEHSSAKPERFLQLCAQDNMTITNVTTPAQIFHLLRRQGMSTVKKPLVNFSPKSLLRHPMATSSAENLTDGQFQKIIDDINVQPANVKKLVFCTGKIYYDLLARQVETDRADVAIVRLEQL